MEYQITKDEVNELLEAGKPTRAMYSSGVVPIGSTPQGNANTVWQELAHKYNFIWDTAKPIKGKANEYITAIPKT